jgi:hypothetical protein
MSVMEVNWLVSRELFPGVRRLISSRRSDSSLHPPSVRAAPAPPRLVLALRCFLFVVGPSRFGVSARLFSVAML